MNRLRGNRKSYLEPEVKRQAEEALDTKIPNPDDEAFETLVIDLINDEDPGRAAWAGKLQGAVIYPGDATDLLRRQNARDSWWRTLTNGLYRRYDEDTGEWEFSKQKASFGAMTFGGLFAIGFALLTLVGVNSAEDGVVESNEPVQIGAVAASARVTPVAPERAEPAPGEAIMRDVRSFSSDLDALLGGETGGSTQATADSTEQAAPAPAPESAAAPAPSGEASPATSSLVAARGRPALTSSVVSRAAPRAGLTSSKARGLSSSIVARRSRSESAGSVSRPAQAPRTSVLSNRTQSTTVDGPSQSFVQAPPSATGGASAEQPSAPSYEGPELLADQPATLTPGQLLDGVLEDGILTTPGSTLPVLVRTDEGVWRGTSSLNDVGRVEINLSEIAHGGDVTPMNAIVIGEDGYPGVAAELREETPAIAADLIGAGLRGVNRYVSELAESRTTTLDSDQVIVNEQPVPLEWAIGGSVAELFSPDPSERSLVRVAQLPAGTRVKVRVQ